MFEVSKMPNFRVILQDWVSVRCYKLLQLISIEIKHNLSLMCRLKELVILGCITFRRRFIPYLSIAQTPVNIEWTNELQIFLHFHVVWAPDFRTEAGVSGLSKMCIRANPKKLKAEATGPEISLFTLISLTISAISSKRYVTSQSKLCFKYASEQHWNIGGNQRLSEILTVHDIYSTLLALSCEHTVWRTSNQQTAILLVLLVLGDWEFGREK